MITDDKGVVERLRAGAIEIDNDGTPSQVGPSSDELREAADRIETLERALRLFVDVFEKRRDFYAQRYADHDLGYANFDKMPDHWPMEKVILSMGDYRLALSAISGEKL